MTNQSLWDTVKAVIKRKFIAMSAYIKRTERSQINDLMLHLKLLDQKNLYKESMKQKAVSLKK
jgi:hypothetical protein